MKEGVVAMWLSGWLHRLWWSSGQTMSNGAVTGLVRGCVASSAPLFSFNGFFCVKPPVLIIIGSSVGCQWDYTEWGCGFFVFQLLRVIWRWWGLGCRERGFDCVGRNIIESIVYTYIQACIMVHLGWFPIMKQIGEGYKMLRPRRKGFLLGINYKERENPNKEENFPKNPFKKFAKCY